MDDREVRVLWNGYKKMGLSGLIEKQVFIGIGKMKFRVRGKGVFGANRRMMFNF